MDNIDQLHKIILHVFDFKTYRSLMLFIPWNDEGAIEVMELWLKSL
jgi:hypothetical protein